jgi:hypothetical protein
LLYCTSCISFEIDLVYLTIEAKPLDPKCVIAKEAVS